MSNIRGWNEITLKDTLDVLTGFAFKSSFFNQESGIPLIRIRDLRTHNSETYYSGDYSNEYIVNKNDLLVGMDGEFNIVKWAGPKSLLNQRIAKLSSKDTNVMDDTFIYYKMQGILKEIEHITPSTTVKHLSKRDIEGVKVCIPQIEEQRKIATILSSIDNVIEKTEKIIEQTKIIKSGLMQELFTKGIGHTEFKDTPVGRIPNAWKVLSFNEVFDRITTKNTVDNQNVLTISGERGLISQLDYFNKSVSSKNLKNYIYLKKNDFAYNKSYSNGYPLGAIKRLERYDVGVVSTLYICFRLKEQYINGFYKYYFDSGYWNRQVYSIAPEGGRSHGLLNVGVKDFFEILIPVPPLEEQRKIKTILNSIDRKTIIEKRRLEKLNSIKHGLMQQLLSGKVRVNVEDREEVPT